MEADYVAFGKRTKVTGYFSNNENINLGGKLNYVKLLSVIKKAIDNESLLNKVS